MAQDVKQHLGSEYRLPLSGIIQRPPRYASYGNRMDAWRAHLAKARDDWNYYKTVLNSGTVVRQVVDSAIGVLREIIRTTFSPEPRPGEIG